MVGCRDGVIDGCTFSNAGRGANGVQAKGGSRSIEIRHCRFEGAGARAVQIGGNTEPQWLRPRNATYEVKDMLVEHNTFVGSEAAIAFASADGGIFRFNTVYRPTRYLIRILQENLGKGMVRCRDGRVTDNLFVWHASDFPPNHKEAINIGPNTKPDTFKFERNWWYCADRPDAGVPALPSAELDGTYGLDPRLKKPPEELMPVPDSPAAKVGAHAKR